MTEAELASRTQAHPIRGGAASAIRHHYDASNAFYGLWLDESMTYSCGLWDEDTDRSDLRKAQRTKLDYHLRNVDIGTRRHILDVGCGWGSLAKRALEYPNVLSATGLTLSDAQYSQLQTEAIERLEVCKQSWIEHEPRQPYDAIVSIGAFEHFARPGQSSAEKLGVYSEFFERCRSWMGMEGRLSLQTIAYGTMEPHEASDFINTHIFPDSELPMPHEVLATARGIFEVRSMRNDREHYGLTCELWHQNLRKRRKEAVALVGEEKVEQYERYLRMSSFGFYSGQICLLRLALTPIRKDRRVVSLAVGRRSDA